MGGLAWFLRPLRRVVFGKAAEGGDVFKWTTYHQEYHRTGGVDKSCNSQGICYYPTGSELEVAKLYLRAAPIRDEITETPTMTWLEVPQQAGGLFTGLLLFGAWFTKKIIDSFSILISKIFQSSDDQGKGFHSDDDEGEDVDPEDSESIGALWTQHLSLAELVQKLSGEVAVLSEGTVLKNNAFAESTPAPLLPSPQPPQDHTAEATARTFAARVDSIEAFMRVIATISASEIEKNLAVRIASIEAAVKETADNAGDTFTSDSPLEESNVPANKHATLTSFALDTLQLVKLVERIEVLENVRLSRLAGRLLMLKSTERGREHAQLSLLLGRLDALEKTVRSPTRLTLSL